MNEKLIELLVDKEAYSLGYAAGHETALLVGLVFLIPAMVLAFVIGRRF